MHICSSGRNFFGRGAPRRHIFGHFNFANSRILADFWSKIAIFYCNEGPVPQNEVSTMNNFLEADYPFFGSVRKNFGHPAPRRHIFGDAEISTKIDFWPKIRIFAILSVRCTQNGWVPWIFFRKKFSPEPLVFEKKSEKGLEWVFTPKWHTWNFGPFVVKFWYFHIFCGVRNFCGRKCGFGVRGGRKFFGPCEKHPKDFPKKFSCLLDSRNPLYGKKCCDHFAIFGFFLIPNPGFREDWRGLNSSKFCEIKCNFFY